MKVYQCVHKYPPHIPSFEKKHGINDESNITFAELRRLIVEDGYASAYILQPALEHKVDEVFYTIWDYDRLQHLWAQENGIESRDLDVIKVEQLKSFKPDVFYNLSPFRDNNIIELIKIAGIKCKTVCWNGIIQSRPMTFPLYDIHLSLHKPHVDYWNKIGLNAFEIQPGIPSTWLYENQRRPIDVLFYGQYLPGMFSNRNRLIDSLLKFKKKSNFRVDIHIQYKIEKAILFKIPKFSIDRIVFPNKTVRRYSLSGIYGDDLYRTISNSKIVVNAYTNYNNHYKSNMRIFEAIGHGAFLISERGHYPEGLVPDTDFYTYSNSEELIEKIELVLGDWEKHQEIAQRTAIKVREYFSKEKQWTKFIEVVISIA